MRESREHLSKVVRKYRKKFSVLLSSSHSAELEMLMARVASTPKGREELEKCVADAESFKPGTGALLREIWHRDKDDFVKDQGKNGKFDKYYLMHIVNGGICRKFLLFGSG